MKCKHCDASHVYRRGLCTKCYRTPVIREQHAHVSRVPLGYGFKRRSEPATATTAPPGSPEKVCALSERAARSEKLHHRDDAPPAAQQDVGPLRISPAKGGFAVLRCHVDSYGELIGTSEHVGPIYSTEGAADAAARDLAKPDTRRAHQTLADQLRHGLVRLAATIRRRRERDEAIAAKRAAEDRNATTTTPAPINPPAILSFPVEACS
jgi:hypothetical protein